MLHTALYSKNLFKFLVCLTRGRGTFLCIYSISNTSKSFYSTSGGGEGHEKSHSTEVILKKEKPDSTFRMTDILMSILRGKVNPRSEDNL